MTIPDIFKKSGEAGFRDIEAEVIKEFGKLSGLVMATGGGSVLRRENVENLRQNGRVYLLTRDVSLLPKDGRPLSLINDLTVM